MCSHSCARSGLACGRETNTTALRASLFACFLARRIEVHFGIHSLFVVRDVVVFHLALVLFFLPLLDLSLWRRCGGASF